MFTAIGTAVKEKQSNSRTHATGVRTGARSEGSPVTATAGKTRLLPHTSYTGMLELYRAFSPRAPYSPNEIPTAVSDSSARAAAKRDANGAGDQELEEPSCTSSGIW